ncbi:uncharacterized protein LOC144749266 [Ciona intestinalis]
MEAIQLLKFILDDIQAKHAVGTTINDQYHLEKLLGKGGFGAAYLAVDKKAPKNAPKKVLKRVMVEMANLGNKSLVRTEAALLAKLTHPYIVKFHESFFDKNIFCIISEYCEGGDLADQIEKLEKSDQAFGDKMVEKIAYQLLCALNYLHTKKVLHRDLKPANVLLKGGDVKLTDFGVSKKLDVREYLTKTLAGTILYVAPEILEEKPYSTKCDLWSLGVVFYEICTLAHPFGTNIAAIVTGNLPTLANQAHQRILSKMLVRQTDQRCNAIDILKDPVFSNIRKNSDIEVRMVHRAEVKLVKGDITKENVDAIVIGVAKQDLTNLGNSPLAGAVLKAAGKGLQDECNASAASKPDMWSVIQVNGHQLPCVHVYIVLMEHYVEKNSKNIKKSYSVAVKKCLEKAEGNSFSTVSFCAMGAGGMGYPTEEIARWMQDEFRGFRTTHLKNIRLVIFPTDIFALQVISCVFKETETTIGKLKVKIHCGDVISEDCDAIIESCDPQYKMNQGTLAPAVRSRGGATIATELSATNKIDGVVVTTGGDITLVEYILHIAVNKSNLVDMLVAALNVAEQLEMHTVAIPAIGTGDLGLEVHISAKCIRLAIEKFSQSYPNAKNLRQITVVVYQAIMLSDFQQILCNAIDPELRKLLENGGDPKKCSIS